MISLRLRLALFGAAVVALTLLLFGVLLIALFARGVNTNQDDALRSRAGEAVATLSATPSTVLDPHAPIVPVDLTSSTDIFVEVLRADGTLIYSTGQLDGAPPPVPVGLLQAASADHGAFATAGNPQVTELRFYAVRFSGGYVVTGQSTRVPRSNLSGIVAFLVISAIPTLLAALAASWLVAGRALRPLKQVAIEADEIGRTRDLGRRLPERRSKDEVARLSASFNRMLGRLQDAFESQRRFVADASHELRTPLTTIQGNAGLLAHGPAIAEPVRLAAAGDIAEESARMARLLDRMLTLARADSGLQLELAPIDLAPLVAEVTRQAMAVHPEPKLEVETASATISGDGDSIRQLLWILLDNARRFAKQRVDVKLSVDGGWARISVADDGPGIVAADRERVFERFYKSDPSRARSSEGAGLGLSIARWITDQHHGRILAAESASGGAAMYVDLPLLRPS